jgi:hypothetical protein
MKRKKSKRFRRSKDLVHEAAVHALERHRERRRMWDEIMRKERERGIARSAGALIAFKPDGTIKRVGGVNNSFGFQLDANGRIKEGERE